jgi:predicted transport protein
MRLFKLNHDNTLSQINEAKFGKEKILQAITEKNLNLIFGLELICSEFPVGDYRLDTLAFDPETKSFVIIEYKRSENRSVIDQGYAYLGKMLDRKADFVLQYNNLKHKSYQIKDIDWAQSRILFVSTSFNTYQVGSLIFNDLPISLWEVKSYKDGHISFRRIDHSSSGASIKKLAPTDSIITNVVKEVVVYTEQDHLQKANEDIQELYETLKDAIQQRWNLNIDPKKLYIAFKKSTNVVDIEIQKAQLKLTLNVPKGKLIDNLNIAQDVSGKGKWGNGDYQIIIKDDTNLSHVLSLIEQSVQLHQL